MMSHSNLKLKSNSLQKLCQSRHWMATIFDLTFDPNTLEDQVSYAVWQTEKAPTTGKLHFQLYAIFKKRRRITQCQKIVKASWNIARSPKDANKYCQKEDTRVEGPYKIGTFEEVPKQGDKFAKLHADMKLFHTMETLVEDHFGLCVRYMGNLTKIRALYTPKRTQHTQLIWIWGPSGAGKSTYAKKMVEGRSVYYKSPTTKWWSHYNQQDVVIIDDFKGALFPAMLFNLAGNDTPIVVEVKGADTQFNSKEIIITSVKHPRFIYGEDTHAWEQGLQRRVEGYTLWMPSKKDKNAPSTVYRTDWVPVYATDTTVPPVKILVEPKPWGRVAPLPKPVLSRSEHFALIDLCKN